MIVQLKTDLVENPLPVESADPAEFPYPDKLKFVEAGRRILWKDGFCQFGNRKKRRYEFVVYMFERVGEYVTAEEIAHRFFDRNRWNWPTVRRFGKRVQEEDLGPKGFPFYLQLEEEGFTLIHSPDFFEFF